MNAKILMVTLALLGGAGALFGMALLGGGQELTVGQIVRGEWPLASVPAERVASSTIAVVGYCYAVERAVGPRWIELVDQPQGSVADVQTPLRVWIEPGASMPDEVRLRAWTRVRGVFDPHTRTMRASRVEMKCPSTEEAREEVVDGDPLRDARPMLPSLGSAQPSAASRYTETERYPSTDPGSPRDAGTPTDRSIESPESSSASNEWGEGE